MGENWKNEKDGGTITVPGNSKEFKTWDWRTKKPVWIKDAGLYVQKIVY